MLRSTHDNHRKGQAARKEQRKKRFTTKSTRQTKSLNTDSDDDSDDDQCGYDEDDDSQDEDDDDDDDDWGDDDEDAAVPPGKRKMASRELSFADDQDGSSIEVEASEVSSYVTSQSVSANLAAASRKSKAAGTKAKKGKKIPAKQENFWSIRLSCSYLPRKELAGTNS